MKKVIVALIAGFAFTYCNPSQQADQTTTDSGRMADSTATMSGQMPSGNAPDTTQHPDTTTRPQQ